MQSKAAVMVLVLLSGTIAGCTSDPDGGGNDEIDVGTLQELFNTTFEEFVENTTITVNNHYYGNDGGTGIGGTNISESIGELYAVDYEFSMVVDNTNLTPLLIYEISVPDGMGVACLSDMNHHEPSLYQSVTQHWNPEISNGSWRMSSQIWNINLDGVYWYCGSGFMGGTGDMVLQMYIPQMSGGYNYYTEEGEEIHQNGDTIDFRLLFTYQLVPINADG